MPDILGDFKDGIDALFAKKKNDGAPVEEPDIVNIMLSGITGVGKSTLLNAVFGEALAETGVGPSLTKEIKVYEQAGVPLRVYDVRGLELDPGAQKKVRSDVKRLVQESRKTETTSDDIHLMWYCVASGSGRLQTKEIEFINDLAQAIDVVVVITQSYNADKTRELMTYIDAKRQEGALHVKAVVPVLATDEVEHGEVVRPAFGLQELADLSYEMLPAAQKRAFAAAQRLSASLRKKAAYTAIGLATAAAAAAATVPIPVVDAVMLVPIQFAMFGAIARVYGRNFKDDDFTKMVDALAPVVAMGAGRAAVASLLKLIPGAGQLIYTSVAAGLTAALGAAFQSAMELGACDAEIDWNEIAPILREVFDATFKSNSEENPQTA
jgi:uncharacterized protein (DUF697 family)/GTP-binding protein EngB required for normal cell division